MHIESTYHSIYMTPPPKYLTLAYFSSAFVMSGLLVTNLALNQWVDYCYWHFGLLHGDTWTAYPSLKDESTINEVYDDMCSEQSFDYACPELCDSVERLQTAGRVMLAFGILSIVSLVIAAVLHLVFFYKRHVGFFKFIYVFDAVPAFMFGLGFIIYCSVADFSDFKRTYYFNLGKDYDPVDLSYGGGFGLAIANLVLITVFTGFSLIVSYKTQPNM